MFRMTLPLLAMLWAAAEPIRPGSPTLSRTTRQVLTGMAPVIAIGLVVLVAFAFWAAFIRKSEAAQRRGRILPESNDAAASTNTRRRRRRRRREKMRPRNPTLAETGGLPPPRD